MFSKLNYDAFIFNKGKYMKQQVMLLILVLELTVIDNSGIIRNKKTIKNEAVKKGNNYLSQKITDTGFQSYFGINRNLNTINTFSNNEIFTSIVIAELIPQQFKKNQYYKNLVKYINSSLELDGTISFFQDNKILSPDIDCTSIGLSVLFSDGKLTQKIINNVTEKIFKNINSKNIIKVYFDSKKKYIDPIVCINALYFLYFIGKNKNKITKENEKFIYDFFKNESYLNGTRYYHSPDTFLFFLTRLVMKLPKDLKNKYHNLLKKAIQKRRLKTNYPLDIAIRVYLSKIFGINNKVEFDKLLKMQSIDGSWPIDGFFRNDNKNLYFGCKELTTAFAIKALSLY